MGFTNRLKRVRDARLPISVRVMALCDALTHCHAGFAEGKAEIAREFGWEIGQGASDELLGAVADYLAEQREHRNRSSGGKR